MLVMVSYILEKPLNCNQALTSSGLDFMSRDGGPRIFCWEYGDKNFIKLWTAQYIVEIIGFK